MEMEGRESSIDILRAASVMYIVGFWHMLDYTEAIPQYHNALTIRITVIILGLFVFLSGFMLGKKELHFGAAAFFKFYKRRLVRIYPLYMGGLTLFLATGLCDKSTWAKAALSISMFYGPPPMTLWFITMLLFFYLVAPFLIATAHSFFRFSLATATVVAAMICVFMISPKADARALIYFPGFALGLLFSRNPKNINFIFLVLASVFSFALSVLSPRNPEFAFSSIPMASIVPLTIVALSGGAFSNWRIIALAKTMSYAGFVMYLIHRPIYVLLINIYFPQPLWLQVMYLLFICSPIIFCLSWLAQKFYDFLLSADSIKFLQKKMRSI